MREDELKNNHEENVPRGDCLVSVILPVYNVRPYLEESLESVVGQTYQNLEILVIDDGSTDGSSEICDRFAEKYSGVKVVHQKHRGPGAARNVGLNMATGSVLAFLDPDDAFFPDAIQKALNAMTATRADIALFKYASVKTEGRLKLDASTDVDLSPQIRKGVYDRKETLRNLADGKINMGVWNKLYIAALRDGLRFQEGVVYEDCQPTVNVFDKATRTVVLDEPLILYRLRANSITATFTLQNIRELNISFSYLETYVRNHLNDIFSEETLQKLVRLRAIRLIQSYKIFVRSNPKEKESLKEIRAMILENSRGITWKIIRTKERFRYFLIRFLPWSLPAFYSCLSLFRASRGKKRVENK